MNANRWNWFVAIVACLLGAANSQAVDSLQLVRLERRFHDFALNPESGDLAGINSVDSTVMLFRESQINGRPSRQIESLKVGNHPVAIIYKKYKAKGVFAVVCEKDSHLYLIDAQAFTLLRKIPLAETGIHSVAGSLNPADPYLYYTYGYDHDAQTGRVNLAKLADEGAASIQAAECAVSASGRLIYAGGPWSDFRCLRRLPDADGKPNYAIAANKQRATAHLAPDPFDIYAASGSAIYTADLSKHVGTLEFLAESFFADRPLIVGTRENLICAGSYNTFREYGAVSFEAFLPEAEGKSGKRRRNSSFDEYSDQEQDAPPEKRRVFADAKNDRVLLAMADRVIVAPLSLFNIVKEPFLRVRHSDSAKFVVGKESKLPFVKFDPKIRCELQSEIGGVKLEGDSISWSPTEDQMGRHELELKISHGDVVVVQSVPVQVVRDRIDLPFSADNLAVSADGKLAVASDHQETGTSSGGIRLLTQLALLDLEKRSIVWTTQLPVYPHLLAIDQKNVYLAHVPNSQITVLSVADPKAMKTLSVSSYPHALHAINNKHLFVTLQSGAVERFSLDGWNRTVVNQAPTEVGYDYAYFRERWDAHGERQNAVVQAIGSDWLIQGVLWDSKLERVKLLSDPLYIAHAEEPDRESQLSAWGNRTPPSLIMGERELIGGVLLSDVPVQAMVTRKTESEHDANGFPIYRSTVELAALSLADNLPKQRLTLAKDEPSNGDGRQHGSDHVHQVGKSVVVAVDRAVYVHSFADVDPADFPEPLHVEPVQPTLVVDTTKSVKSPAHRVRGGRKPYRSSLTSRTTGIGIDQTTGELTIDGPALQRKVTTDLIERISSGFIPSEEEAPDWQEHTLESLTLGNGVFETITRRKPNGIPLLVHVDYRVEDSDGQSATLHYGLLVEIDAKSVTDKLTAIAKEKAEKREKALADSRLGALSPGDIRTADKLRVLENRIQSLEAKIDALTKLLSEKLPPDEEP